MFHSRTPKAKRTKLLCKYQLVLPSPLIQTILKLYHDSPLGAHSGIQDTIDRVKENYFFNRLSQIVSDYIRTCDQCQSRKITKVHTKSAIVAYPTPQEPFSVWEIDLYGVLPLTNRGNTYLFTAVDMFSKLLHAKPIPNKVAITVSEALIDLFTQFGTCDTLICDRGIEFTTKVTSELCKMMHIQQQFTPSYVHHCLGVCERQHRTLAERRTPFINDKCNNWDQMVNSVAFSMNNSVNSSMGYSPFEIIYGQRPKFPLSANSYSLDLKSVPKDFHSYLEQKEQVLTFVRKT